MENQNTDKRINRTDILLEDLHSKFNVFGENLLFVKDDVSGLKDGQDALFEMVGKSTVDIEEIKKEIKEIRKELSGKLTKKEGEKLGERIFVIEQKLGLA